jgi:hypothetical protein
MGDAVGLTGDAGGADGASGGDFDGFNSGWIHFGVPGTEHVDGTTPLREVITQLVTRG